MPNFPCSRAHALVLTASALCGSAVGAESSGTGLPLWEVGAGALALSQQAYPGAEESVFRTLALPYVIYRGRWLRADEHGIGVRPFHTPNLELDVSAAASFGAGANEVRARRGMPRLGTLVEFGPRLQWHLGEAPGGGRWRLDLPLRGVFDLGDAAAYRGLVGQPGITWQKRTAPWTYGAGVSALVADRRLASTFYEVAPAYATPSRPAYEAHAGLVAWRFSASIVHELGRDWRLIAYARVDSVSGARNRASPLVRQTTGATAGVGITYTWTRSSATAAD